MEIPGYKIQRHIGKGGMADVYLAIQESLGRAVVLKVMSTQLSDSPEFAKRFLNEGHLLASVNHPNIITIYDIGIAETFLYISMEFLEGSDLTRRLRSGISPLEALEIVYRIAGALSVAHRKGIVHRDVKPANILFRDDGTPVLTDFGIAKLAGDNELTSTGTILGSPYYMSPEQVEGKTELDGRSDIYSLGIIFHEMLTGQRPYEGDSAINIVLQHLQSPLPKLPGELQFYQPLLNLMLAKRREDRFPDAERLRAYVLQLQQAQQGAPVDAQDLAHAGATNPTPGSTPRRYTGGHITQQLAIIRRRRLRTWIAVAIAVCFISGLLAWYFTSELHRYDALAVTPITPYRPAPAGATSNGLSEGADMGPLHSQVLTALQWLARRSLEEQRLTAPPEDNAYFYYSRLLELDPSSAAARHGIAEVARRYADLAEQAVRDKDYDRAERYLVQGLFVDPENKRLQVLRSNLLLRERGLVDTLLGLF